MKWLTLDYIKAHSRIEINDEDTILTVYAEAAEDTLLGLLNRTYEEIIDLYGAMPKPLMQASLMLVDVSYQHRSPVSPTSISIVPYTFDILIKPYVRLAGSYVNENAPTEVVIGSDEKIAFTASLPDDLTLEDVDFTVTLINYSDASSATNVTVSKSDCIESDENTYIVKLATSDLGIGEVRMKLSCQIPDTDYQSGYRTLIVNINPKIRIIG